LAGFSIGIWGEQVAFVADSVTFLVSAAAILTMAVPRTTSGRGQRRTTRGEMAAVAAEIREGVVYLFGNRTMVGVLLCLGVVQLGLGAINVIWVPFMRRIFGLGPEGLGAVDAAQGVGMALGGLVLGLVAGRFQRKRLASWSIVLIGIMIALMGLSPAFSLAHMLPDVPNAAIVAAGASPEDMAVGQRLLYLPLMLLVYSLVLGIALVPAQSALMTMMQLAVPDLKRGRVGSALNALTTAAGLISMVAAAAMGEMAPLRAIYVVSGLLVSAGGVVGLYVLQEPEPGAVGVDLETIMDEGGVSPQ
ncbi:MAG: MFS transporter, partial [Anaerolineae bacterium]